MRVTQLADVIVPSQFTDYIVHNTLEQSALVQSGIVVRNGVIESQLAAGADSFSVPFWNDLSDDEANIVSDDPTQLAVPRKVTVGKHTVRKAYLHAS